MDTDILHLDVDQSVNMPVPDANSKERKAAEAIRMVCGVSALLEHNSERDVDHAVSTNTCSMGRQGYLYEPQCQRGYCSGSSNHIGGLGLFVRSSADSISLAGTDRLQDQGRIMGTDVPRFHYWSLLPG